MAKEEKGRARANTDPMPPIPPDGGYGWVIMFASFICNVIVDGVCFSFGIFYLEFLSDYGASKAKTSWVGSVLNGMYLSMGPIVSALANKFGCRAVTIVGSFVAMAAFFLSTFSTNVDVLILTYGALGGMGFGLMYLPAIVMVGFYFEKRRAFATGVAVCGSGIGAFVFAPMCEALISAYGWRGATWIIAGIVLNGMVMGALFRPLESPPAEAEPNIVVNENGIHADENCQKTRLDSAHSDKIAIETGEIRNGRVTRLSECSQDEGGTDASRQRAKTINVKLPMVMQSLQNLSPSAQNKLSSCEQPILCQSMDDIHIRRYWERKVSNKDIARPMYRKDIFYSGSVHNLPEYRSHQDLNGYTQSVTAVPPTDGSQTPCFRICKSFTDTMKEMMDFSILKNPVFTVYGMSCFLCMTGFYVPFIYLPDHALSQGISRDQAAFLLSIIGIANTVARVACGWVSDQSWADCLIINNSALIIGGVATIASPYCNSYGLLAAYSAVFGAAIAVFVALRSIIMVELIGLKKLTNAFGLVTFCQGMSAFIGAPIAGALYDATGDYKISFYFAGICLALAGLICLPLRRIARWQAEREKRLLSSDGTKEYQRVDDGESKI